MERTPRQLVPVVVTDPQPIPSGFVEDVRQNLDGFHNGISSKTDPDHVRLDPPRRPRVSNTQAQVISSAKFGGGIGEDVVATWQRESLILWARELVEAEMFRSRVLAINPRNPGPV
jgi:hypothetical protein